MKILNVKSYGTRLFCGLLVLLMVNSCGQVFSGKDTGNDASPGENPAEENTDSPGVKEEDDKKEEQTGKKKDRFTTLHLEITTRNVLTFEKEGEPVYEEFDPANWKDVLADTDLDMERYGNIPSNIARGGLLAFSDDLYFIVRNHRIFAGFPDTEEEWLLVEGLRRGTQFLNYYQGHLFFVNTHAIWRYTLSGGELVRLNIGDIDVKTLFVFDDKLYFSGRDCCVYAFHLSSGELTILVEEPVLHFSVCDQWLTWISEDDEQVVADLESLKVYRTGIETHTFSPSYHHRHLLFCMGKKFQDMLGTTGRRLPVSFVMKTGDKQMVVVPASNHSFAGVFRNRLAMIQEGARADFLVMSHEPDSRNERRGFRWRCIREDLPLVYFTSVYDAYFTKDRIFLNEDMDYFYYRYYNGLTGVVEPSIAPELLEDEHPWKESPGYELERLNTRLRVPDEGLTVTLTMVEKNGEPFDPATRIVNFGECEVTLLVERDGEEARKITTDVGSCTAKLLGYGYNTVFLETYAGEAGGLNIGHYLHKVCLQHGECIESGMQYVNYEGAYNKGFFFSEIANVRRFYMAPYDESFFEQNGP